MIVSPSARTIDCCRQIMVLNDRDGAVQRAKVFSRPLFAL